jgi:hypothetical protein
MKTTVSTGQEAMESIREKIEDCWDTPGPQDSSTVTGCNCGCQAKLKHEEIQELEELITEYEEVLHNNS